MKKKPYVFLKEEAEKKDKPIKFIVYKDPVFNHNLGDHVNKFKKKSYGRIKQQSPTSHLNSLVSLDYRSPEMPDIPKGPLKATGLYIQL